MLKKKALLVDDDPDCLELMQMMLEKLDFEVISATSQKEGEALIQSETVQLAVFDLMMENHDSGFVLCHKFKRKNPHTPVIMVTNVARETGIRFQGFNSGENQWVKADAILEKSIRFDQLKHHIDQLMPG
ncbi:MAG: response regulator [Acidobacteria bacterium]|nr:MAG: response regulator [Acidobacteriota bacterium]